MEKVYNDTDLLHPVIRRAIEELEQKCWQAYKDAQVKHYFRVFETYRTPRRQDSLYGAASRSKAYRSAHQYGLAADFAGFVDGDWSWDPHLDWDGFGRLADQFGPPIWRPLKQWDKGHVEWTQWTFLRLQLPR